MEESLLVSLDKLPIKRLDAIEENGVERFPSYVSSFHLLLYRVFLIFSRNLGNPIGTSSKGSQNQE